MTRQEFHQNLYDSMTDRFRSLDENWSTFIESPIKDVNEGRVTSDLAVIVLAQAVEMLGLRIQYLQSTITALAGGQIAQDHLFLKSRPANQPKKSDRGLNN
jgi:hypothetical protein